MLLALAACGRIGFDKVAHDADLVGGIDAADSDAATTSSLVPECEWLVDSNSDLSTASTLEGQTISGVAYFSLRCTSDVQGASLWFEDGTFEREPDNILEQAPFDFVSDVGTPVAFDTKLLHTGEHTLSAWVTFDLDGLAVRIVRAEFQVSSQDDPHFVVGSSSRREDAVPLLGQVLSGDVFISLRPGSRREETFGPVVFYLDGNEVQRESDIPFDFMGGDDFFGAADELDTLILSIGIHSVQAIVAIGDATEMITTTFEVQ